jgi:hypothetical protein
VSKTLAVSSGVTSAVIDNEGFEVGTLKPYSAGLRRLPASKHESKRGALEQNIGSNAEENYAKSDATSSTN